MLRHRDLSSYNVRKIIFGLVLLCFGACSTPEFQAVRSFCEASFFDQIPQVFRQRIVTNYRTELRVTGKSICTTEGNITICEQEKEKVRVPYLEVEFYDANNERRYFKIQTCAKLACQAKYGNTACKVSE